MLLKKILLSLNQADQWIVKNIEQATQLYARSTGLKAEVASKSVDRRLKPSPINTINPDVVKSQQNIADLFKEVNLIPKSIQIQQVIWTPSSTH